MVIPLIRPNQHFTSDERDALQVMIDKDLGTASIARIIGKHVSNIYLEPGRNAVQGSCLSVKAHTAASSRRKGFKATAKRRQYRPHAGYRETLQPGSFSRHVWHETIYQHLYARQLEDPELRLHLRQGNKKRRKRLSGKDKRGVIPNRRFIDERPIIVDEKTRTNDDSRQRQGVCGSS